MGCLGIILLLLLNAHKVTKKKANMQIFCNKYARNFYSALFLVQSFRCPSMVNVPDEWRINKCPL